MARNKYPEVTVEKILEAAQRLFLEKGYDSTTIQDIVDELGGLTKGAIYHHFKSKEEIMHALGDKLFLENNPFDAVRGRTDLNGLQKIREMLLLNQADRQRTNLNTQALPILENPRILAAAIEANRRVLTPLWLELLEEGRADGSIQTEYPRELAELLPLINFWLLPSLYPATGPELRHKLAFLIEALAHFGLPLFPGDPTERVEQFLSEIAPDR